jgi:methyl-accepting chemotaxis protein
VFKDLKLTPKIAGAILAALLCTSTIAYFVSTHRINEQAESSFVDKLRKTDGMAGTMRSYFSSNIETYAPGHQFKDLKQVPVVVAWSVARQYAESQGMKFSTPSLHPRNPSNTPDAFEAEALHAFEADPNLGEFYRRVNLDVADVMRYAQPVRLTEDCLYCHGDPAGEKDPFGHAKEGMHVGDLKGAFVVTAPITELTEASASNSRSALLTNFVMLVISFLVAYLVVKKFVVKPVTASAELAEQIAGNNLAVSDIEVRSSDEIGQSILALNLMKNNLRSVVEKIASTAEHLASASTEISASAELTSEGATGQKDRTNQVTVAMQEMAATVQEVAKNSSSASDAARQTAAKAQDGGQVVTRMVDMMRGLAASVGSTAMTVGELGKRSESIGEIISVINDIADQTNLLALNAAIEAARAGEQGRGFAVVADEVRKLAERTSQATKEIASMIASVQDETRKAVTEMEGGRTRVDDCVTAASEAGRSLQEIIQMAQRVGDMVTQIASAATEQSAATDEVNSGVDEIAKLTAGSASGAEQTAKACHDLARLAQDLQAVVGRFQLNGSRSVAPALETHRQRSPQRRPPTKVVAPNPRSEAPDEELEFSHRD